MNTTHHTTRKACLRFFRGGALLVALSALLFTGLPAQAQTQAGSVERISLRVPSFQCSGAKGDYVMSGKAAPCWGTGTRQPLYVFDFKGPHGGGGGGGNNPPPPSGGQNAFQIKPDSISLTINQDGKQTLTPGIAIPEGASVRISPASPVPGGRTPRGMPEAQLGTSSNSDPTNPNQTTSQVINVTYTAPQSLDDQKSLQGTPLVLEVRVNGDTQNRVSRIPVRFTGSPAAVPAAPAPGGGGPK